MAGGVALGTGLGLSVAWGETKTLAVLSHKVHENVARGLVKGTTGGDVAGEWAQASSVELNWVTGNIDPIHDRLGRELS
ncbi:transcriptional antiterminator, partial [Rhizobiaceae sp. 2RAB30]